MKSQDQLRDLADKAERAAEEAASDESRHFFEGIEYALRWAAGDGSTDEIDALRRRVFATRD